MPLPARPAKTASGGTTDDTRPDGRSGGDQAADQARLPTAEVIRDRLSHPRELVDLPPTLTVEQAAELLGIGRNQTYEAVARGEVPAMRIGRRWIIPTVRLLKLLGVGADDAEQSRTARRAAR
jgi:excisionase family DNA binding protein